MVRRARRSRSWAGSSPPPVSRWPMPLSMYGSPTAMAITTCKWRTATMQRFVRGSGPTRKGASASRSEEHTSELQSLMRNSYDVFCLKKKNNELHTHKEYIQCHEQCNTNSNIKRHI